MDQDGFKIFCLCDYVNDLKEVLKWYNYICNCFYPK